MLRERLKDKTSASMQERHPKTSTLKKETSFPVHGTRWYKQDVTRHPYCTKEEKNLVGFLVAKVL